MNLVDVNLLHDFVSRQFGTANYRPANVKLILIS